jgi:hypothetical protein
LYAAQALMWWYWPEAHGFFVNPVAVWLMSLCMLSDIVYPFVLARVRRTERVMPDGSIVCGSSAAGVERQSLKVR